MRSTSLYIQIYAVVYTWNNYCIILKQYKCVALGSVEDAKVLSALSEP